MPPNNFCIFVLTHGRPDRIFTVPALREFKYTGKIYLVVDDEDRALEAYRKRFGDDVLTFSKADIAARFDEGDNFNDRRSVFYARNACFDLARQVGVRYFMQCDDDYSGFYIRWNSTNAHRALRAECLDEALEAMIDYFKTTPALSIAMSQGGDHIGGGTFGFSYRKAMNTFLCDVERPFAFIGRINEDVNTYTTLGRRGDLFLTIPNLQVNQKQTQRNPGGMTELYQDSGTYVKTFYSVMYCPSAVRVAFMNTSHKRVHHVIDWPTTTAQIVSSRYRKARGSQPRDLGGTSVGSFAPESALVSNPS